VHLDVPLICKDAGGGNFRISPARLNDERAPSNDKRPVKTWDKAGHNLRWPRE
jgi:hypothetical protein